MKALKQRLSKESVVGVLFTPSLTIGFLLFVTIPMGISLYYSSRDYNIPSPPVLTGMRSFISMFRDETFSRAPKVTFLLVFASVPLKLLFTSIAAILLLENSKILGFYRVVYHLPSIIGGFVAVPALWERMPVTDGAVNKLSGLMGMKTNFSQLGDIGTTIWVLILLVVQQFGSFMLIFLPPLEQAPQLLYEAANVDRASGPTKSFKITLPLLTPTTFSNPAMQMINGFLAFIQCYVITQGKLMNSTLLYTAYMYKQSPEFYNTGYGTTPTWVMLTMTRLTALLPSATKRFWIYEGGLRLWKRRELLGEQYTILSYS